MPTKVDPITREVVQNRLVAIVREMSATLQRAAYSPIIYEVKDFSSVLLRPDGSVIAQAEGIPVFIGAMQQMLAPILERYPLPSINEGDVFISNDPFLANGGMHKNDVNILKPIFTGGRLSFFAATKAHWTDIGGKDPGSWSPDATNTHQEGVTIPPIRLYRHGVLNEEAQSLILAGTRLRENNEGDLLAQLSACHIAEVRVHELVERYPIALIDACIDSLLDYAEAKVRSAIDQVPDGTYTGESFVDSDGVSDVGVRILVHATVSGGDLTLDFRDCEAQRNGASGNAYLVNTVAACRVAVKCLFGPDLVTNEGFFRPLHILTTPGTVTHPVYPAPGTVWDNIGVAIIESVFFALAPVIPERVTAGISGGVQAMAIAGTEPGTGAPFIHFMPYAGGWGARLATDGVSALCTILNGDNDNIPCEITEARFPLRVERYELIPDSGGAGRTRGGLGVRTDYRILCDGATVSAGISRWSFAPPGLFGGSDGMRSTLILDVDGNTEERPLLGGHSLPKGALISHRIGGGGGFGHPNERARDAVLADIEAGYVTEEAARQEYGLKDLTPSEGTD